MIPAGAQRPDQHASFGLFGVGTLPNDRHPGGHRAGHGLQLSALHDPAHLLRHRARSTPRSSRPPRTWGPMAAPCSAGSIFPLSLPGVLSGITMVFIPSVSTFAISRLLGGGKTPAAGRPHRHAVSGQRLQSPPGLRHLPGDDGHRSGLYGRDEPLRRGRGGGDGPVKQKRILSAACLCSWYFCSSTPPSLVLIVFSFNASKSNGGVGRLLPRVVSGSSSKTTCILSALRTTLSVCAAGGRDRHRPGHRRRHRVLQPQRRRFRQHLPDREQHPPDQSRISLPACP